MGNCFILSVGFDCAIRPLHMMSSALTPSYLNVCNSVYVLHHMSAGVVLLLDMVMACVFS